MKSNPHSPRKKHSLSLLMVLAILACALPLAAQTTVTNAASIYGGSGRGYPQRTVSPPWRLSHTGGVSGVQLDLSYLPNKLNVGGFQRGDFSNNVAFYSRQIAPGQQRVLFYAKDGSELETNVVFGSLPVTIPAGDYQGGGRLTITNAIVARTNGIAALPLGLADGGVFSTTIFHGDDGVVDLLLVVQSNRLWVVQATTNFVNWVNIATNYSTLDYVVATDTDAPHFPLRFYRAKLYGAGSGGQISGVSLQSGGSLLTFGYATTAGRTYILQSSTNLTSWSPLKTNVAAGGLLNFTNLISTNVTRQFFRVLELP